MRGSLFANAHGDESRIDHLIQHISDLDESLGGARPELFEAFDGFLSRGESADGIDGEVRGELLQGRGERVGFGCHG